MTGPNPSPGLQPAPKFDAGKTAEPILPWLSSESWTGVRTVLRTPEASSGSETSTPPRQRPQSFWVPLGLLSKQNPTEPTRTAEEEENAGPKSGPGQPLFSVTGSVPKADGVTRGRSFETRMVTAPSDVTESETPM